MSGQNTSPTIPPYGYYPPSSNTHDHDPARILSFHGSQAPLQPPYEAQMSPEAVPALSGNPAGSSIVAGEPNPNPPGKVRISRQTVSNSPAPSGRVSRACEPCREQKAKCSGHQPACKRCQDSSIRCSYGDRKREKLARQLSDLTNQVQTYETLLQGIFPMLDPQLARRVEHCLPKQGSQDDDDSDSPVSHQISSTPAASKVSNTANSSHALMKDYVDEDFNSGEELQATGFIGEHSEIAWLYRLKGEIEQVARGNPISLLPRESLACRSVASVNYFSNNSQALGHAIGDANLFERSQPLAFRLVGIYFQMVHPCFQIISSKIFLEQVKDFYSAPSGRTGKRWLAILNLVCAIAARYSYLVQDSAGQQLDFERYFSRAWKLNDASLIDPPNLQKVQIEALTAFYLLSVGQINRSWRICDISIGSALSMGLNLRNENIKIPHAQKEIRYRVWWSLLALDTLLCTINGRPFHKSDGFCTTPLPLPFTEEEFRDEEVFRLLSDDNNRNAFMASLFPTPVDQTFVTTPGSTPQHQLTSTAAETVVPNISLYFLNLIDLVLIVRQSIQALYAPEMMRKSWTGVEMAIFFLNRKADTWLSGLPTAFRFRETSPGNRIVNRQTISLALQFYSTKILILQPCLARFNRKASKVSTEIPGRYCNDLAALCVDSACDMLDLLPDQPDSAWLYRISPWASVLHYLMQSITVLLTDLFNRENPGDDDTERVIARVNKAIRWLQDMSKRDNSSRQAWLLCTELLSRYPATTMHLNG